MEAKGRDVLVNAWSLWLCCVANVGSAGSETIDYRF